MVADEMAETVEGRMVAVPPAPVVAAANDLIDEGVNVVDSEEESFAIDVAELMVELAVQSGVEGAVECGAGGGPLMLDRAGKRVPVGIVLGWGMDGGQQEQVAFGVSADETVGQPGTQHGQAILDGQVPGCGDGPTLEVVERVGETPVEHDYTDLVIRVPGLVTEVEQVIRVDAADAGVGAQLLGDSAAVAAVDEPKVRTRVLAGS
jgi:hypothetical protein